MSGGIIGDIEEHLADRDVSPDDAFAVFSIPELERIEAGAKAIEAGATVDPETTALLVRAVSRAGHWKD